MFQAWGLAMAIHPDDGARPGGAPLVGLGRGHLVDDECGQCLGGGTTTRGYGCAGAAALVGGHCGDATPPAPSPVAAPGLVVVPGVSDHHGRPANATALHPRAMARDTNRGPGGHIPSEYLGIQ